MQNQFDIITAKKLLSSYAEKVNYYMKENKLLRNELKDVKTTLDINKEILYKNINEQKNEKKNKIFTKLKEENERLTKKLEELYKDKIDLEKKLYKCQQDLEDSIVKRQEIENNEKTSSFKYDNLLKEKENIIYQLKKELNKYYKDDFSNAKEIIICEPDKVNLEINNELVETRELFHKFSKLLHIEKKKSLEQEKQIEKLNQKIQDMKKKKRVKDKMENIQMFNYILTSSEESDNCSEKGSILSNLESPLMNFPEKIKHKKYLSTEISDYGQNVPKLDFSKLLNKYTPIKSIDVIEGIKASNRDNDEYIDKLKFQLKIYKNSIRKYKKKNHELKKLVSMLKEQCIKLRSNLQNSDSTKDKTIIGKNNNFDKKENNESMEGNTSNIDVDSNFTESDFNYIIREYNKEIESHLN